MKKTFSIILLCITILSTFTLFSCGNNSTDTETQNEGYKVALDLTEEWNKNSNGTELVQGCLVVRREFAEKYPETVASFLNEYKASIEFTNSNPNEAGAMISDAKILPNKAVAIMAIPNCNIAYMDGNEMKASMSAFLEAMYSVAPASIGNALPNDDFYYQISNSTGTADKINVATLNGTTGFGMAKLISDNKNNEKFNFSVESDPTKIIAGLSNGSIDIAALPTNAASNVYNKTNGKIQVAAINTLGVLYVLDKTNEINSLEDLNGKTIYCPAQNPTFILKYILEVNNINATIDSTTYSSPDDLTEAAKAGLVNIAVLPEPKVSIVLSAGNWWKKY